MSSEELKIAALTLRLLATKAEQVAADLEKGVTAGYTTAVTSLYVLLNRLPEDR